MLVPLALNIIVLIRERTGKIFKESYHESLSSVKIAHSKVYFVCEGSQRGMFFFLKAVVSKMDAKITLSNL